MRGDLSVDLPWSFSRGTLEYGQRLLQEAELVLHLATLAQYHRESYMHSLRVGFLVIDLGRAIELSSEELVLAARAGLLHDLGKCDIAIEALSKPGPLDRRERYAMDQHTRYGFDRLVEPGFTQVRKIVVAHHEVKDCPYPRTGIERRQEERPTPERRFSEPEIRRLTELVAVADMFDALASARGYKPALNMSEVGRLMTAQYKGNPTLVELCLERYGKGSPV